MRSSRSAPVRRRQPAWFDVLMGNDALAALERLASLTRTTRVRLHDTGQWQSLSGAPIP